MNPILAAGWAALRRRPRRTLALLAWALPEALPAAACGLVMARAVDRFLSGATVAGLAWLALLAVVGVAGAIGARQGFRRLADIVEPFRDDLLGTVVRASIDRATTTRGPATDDGVVARLTQQVEVVRDTYAGLLVTVRGFALGSVGAMLGMLSLAPVLALLLVPPFLLGLLLCLATVPRSLRRQREYVRATELTAARAGLVLSGVRDVAATGTGRAARGFAGEAVDRQAAAERSLARLGSLRTLFLGVGAWVPLVAVLLAAPWLIGRGLTAGQIVGALTYVMQGLNPVLRTVVHGIGAGALRYAVTLERLLDSALPTGRGGRATVAADAVPTQVRDVGGSAADMSLRDVTFAYGPHAEPVVDDLSLTVPTGDHLAIIGPSGIGKSTLAGLMCGLLRPDRGTVLLGGHPVDEHPAEILAATRTLIPQEAYLHGGSVWENLTYLNPSVEPDRVDRAVAALGADALVTRLGGYRARLRPAALSAGEGQLVALVRAYLADARIVVLDEATCHLTPEAEARVEQTFARREGGTLVVIAHRLSSALRARRILLLDGRRAVLGDHASLLADAPLYGELLGHWSDGAARAVSADPAGLPRDVDRLDAGTGAELADSPG
ncbi:MAG: ABC transporter ATP-binding protein [Actinocatenispora sp.]